MQLLLVLSGDKQLPWNYVMDEEHQHRDNTYHSRQHAHHLRKRICRAADWPNITLLVRQVCQPEFCHCCRTEGEAAAHIAAIFKLSQRLHIHS